VRPVSPVLTAFKQDLALPSGVRGPVLSWEFARLAASCDVEMGGGVVVSTGAFIFLSTSLRLRAAARRS
jgi:hypothetical protein